MAKTIAWADQSGDVITLTAPAWSGSQTVTLSTPENFGIARELNIIFYSESNPAVSATLNVKQAGATLSLSETSVVFGGDETSAKTITVTTNMSTLSGASLVLEGDDASNFTLSALSALSGGTATFTIKPNSVNSGTSARNVTIKLTAGRLSTLSLPVTQEADSVVSTTYENYRIANPVAYYALFGSLRSQITSSTTILAKAGTVYLGGTPMRTKVTTYTSGKVDRVDEEISSSSTVYYNAGGWCSDGYWRFTKKGSTSVSTIIAGNLMISMDSLEYTLRSAGDLSINCDISNVQLSGDPSTEMTSCLCEENKRESYSSFSGVAMFDKQISIQAQSFDVVAYAMGTCTYTSEYSRTENVPLNFKITSGFWATFLSQSPGAAGTVSQASTATLQASATTGGKRTMDVAAYYILADGALGPSIVASCVVTQTPKYGTLTVRASSPYYNKVLLSFFYGSVGSDTQLGNPYTLPTITPTLSVPADIMVPVIDEYKTTPRAEDVIVAYMSQANPYGNPLKRGVLTPRTMDSLIAAIEESVDVK